MVDDKGNQLAWISLAKKKAQRYMDNEWADIMEAFELMKKESVQYEEIRKTMLDVKSFIESAMKRQEETNNKFLEMFNRLNAKIEGK